MKKHLLRALVCAGLAMGSVVVTACGEPAAEDPIGDAGAGLTESDMENESTMPDDAGEMESGMEESMAGDGSESESTEMDAGLANPNVATGAGCAVFDGDERFIPVAELAAAVDDPDCAAAQNLVFVDARPELDYEFGHIPGAVNVPYFNAQAFADELPRDAWLVLYCECPHAEAVQLADALTSEQMGFSMVKVIDEGLGGWRDLGREIVTSEAASADEG